MKTIKEILKIFIVIIICIATYAFSSYEFFGYDYGSAIEVVDSESMDDLQFSKLIYQYENDSYALVVYNNSDGMFVTSHIKKNINGTGYKNIITTTMNVPRVYDPVMRKVSRNLYYIYVKEKDDIKKIDCMGYVPQGEFISYQNTAGEKYYCWIYVIDKTK